MVNNKNQLLDKSHLFLSPNLFLIHRKTWAQADQPNHNNNDLVLD